MPRLLVEEDGEKRSFDLEDRPLTIGRDLSNEVVIRDRMSSRAHCRVEPSGDAFTVRDLGSSNGTLLNGSAVKEAVLHHGDVVRVGEVRIHFEHPDSLTAEETPVAPVQLEEQSEPPTATDARPALVFLGGPRSGDRVELDRFPFTLGRKPSNDLPIPDNRVSGQHAVVQHEMDRWWIEDSDSGNGVFVGKKKIKKHLLRAGDVVTLGQTQLRFEGVPTPSVPAESSVTGSAVVLQGLDEGGISEDELSRVARSHVMDAPTSPFQAVWTGIFLVLFVVILYFGYTIISSRYLAQRDQLDPDNLLQLNPSFEAVTQGARVPGWSADPFADPVNLEVVENESQVARGRRALRVTSPGGERGFVRVVGAETHEVAVDGLRLSGQIFNESFEVAGLSVQWLVRKADGDEVVAESFTSLTPRRGRYSTLGGDLSPPPWAGAELARVAVVAIGRGSLLVDALSLTEKAESEPLDLALALQAADSQERDLRLRFNPDGTFSLERGRELMVRNLRFAAATEKGVPFGQLLPLTQEPPSIDDSGAVSSRFRILTPSRKKIVVDQRTQRVGSSLKVSWRTDGDELEDGESYGVVVELDPRRTRLPATLFLEGAKVAEGFVEELPVFEADEWVFGTRTQQIIVSFSTPVRCHMLPESRSRGVPTLWLEAVGTLPGENLELFFTTVSTREQDRIASLTGEIEQARKGDRPEIALEKLDQLEEEFRWREDVRDLVRDTRAEIQKLARSRLAELEQVHADLAQYPDSPVLLLFRERVQEIQSAYGNGPTAAEAQALSRSVEQEIESALAEKEERDAERLLEAARRHFGQNRNQLARFYASLLIQRHPGTATAADAQQLLKLIDVRE